MEPKQRLKEIQNRLNDIWFSGKGPAGGDIREENKEEFAALLEEEMELKYINRDVTVNEPPGES